MEIVLTYAQKAYVWIQCAQASREWLKNLRRFSYTFREEDGSELTWRYARLCKCRTQTGMSRKHRVVGGNRWGDCERARTTNVERQVKRRSAGTDLGALHSKISVEI